MLEANIRDNQELSQLIQQANSKREAIALVQEGQPKAVVISVAPDLMNSQYLKNWFTNCF
ncbi:hypothetical protein [Nostoc sp.]